jgi:TetR/AcrR family transcriptional regulator
MGQSAEHLDMRVERGARARAEIMKAAERIFAANGVEGASTEAIAEAAKVNKALLFYHFKTKDALFRAVAEDALGQFHRECMALLSARASAREVLLHYLDEVFDGLSSQPRLGFLLQRTILSDSKWTEQVARKYFMPRLKKLTALIARGINEGEFRQVDPFQTALSLNGLVGISFLTAHAVKKMNGLDLLGRRSLEQRKDSVLDFVRHGLFRHPEVIHYEP